MKELKVLHRHVCEDGNGILWGYCNFGLERLPTKIGFVQLKPNEVLIVPTTLLDDEFLSNFGTDAKFRQRYWRDVSWARLGANACDSDGNFRNDDRAKPAVDKAVDRMQEYPNYSKIYQDLVKERIESRYPVKYMQYSFFRFLRAIVRQLSFR